MQIIANSELLGSNMSITFSNDYTHFFTGTNQSNIYWLFTEKLLRSFEILAIMKELMMLLFLITIQTFLRLVHQMNFEQVPNLECLGSCVYE
ncbi:unnamed protein product [Paramecium octaurelia]|uniref:Uncharacterized protein n=1 Tax=Paramecium octaurelia TaxID=43137 RepID=A0A8S1XTR0_PAROT|nr:unnamed protein product [Paramecium octaurelia]